ncbi:MAG: hypothetical protein K2V38_11060 [Gemmataceae bacterium]|nr:hypothetical protein [Gemmataceae bacterium]
MTTPNRASAQAAAPTTPPQAFDPMKGTVVSSAGGGVEPNSYSAEFAGAEYIAACDPDPMTGKGGRQWPSIKFTWRLEDGRAVTRETSANKGLKSGFIETVGWLIGKPLAANEAFDLTACVGQVYLITVGPKLNKAGQPTGWNEVVACIKLPTKK